MRESGVMEWVASAVAIIMAFLASLMPSFGREVRYRMALPSSVVRPHVEILFGGDMMFDRSIRVAMQEHGDDHVFTCIKDVLAEADLVVANLEGPITDNSSISVGSTPGDSNNFTFTFASSTAALLKRHNINLVNLGNNHILNFGSDGLVQTKRYLEAAGVSYFGDPDAVEADRVARLEIGGIRFSFVNWSDWPARPGTSDKTDHTVSQVREEAESGRTVIVYTHWGEEYVPATERMKILAHQFIDAGAEIVIGSHPHVVQEHEIYNGKHIYYSLGNFIFDQYWTEEVRTGLLVQVSFESSGVIGIEEIPISLERDRRTCPVNT